MMRLTLLSRKSGSFLASFFMYFLCNNSFAGLSLLNASQHPVWHELIHFRDSKPVISDPKFLISFANTKGHPTPLSELQATKKLFLSEPYGRCRFPARYEWLIQQKILEVESTITQCPELDEFLDKAPADDFSVIYASENLTQPTSMMGHAMLAISGQREDGQQAEHSVSFLTELDSINLFTIIKDTLVVGKEGYFLVQPLWRHFNFYLLNEQRSVWQYTLNLTPDQKRLMHTHIWELKDIDIKYFFHTHNCATLTLDLVALANPDINDNAGWVSPADLAKRIDRYGLVETSALKPSSRWEVRMLQDIAPDGIIQRVKAWTHDGYSLMEDNWPDQKRYLTQRLAKAYLEYQQQTEAISSQQYEQYMADLNSFDVPGKLALDISAYRSPLLTPPDSQWTAGWQHFSNRNWLTLTWLPASHSLEDDNRQYFSENELKMGEFSIRLEPLDARLQLNRLQILSARSFTPYESMTGGISGGFNAGLYRLFDQNLNRHLGLQVKAGVGLTTRLSADLSVYGLVQTGINGFSEHRYAYLEPEMGGYLYEVFDMKTWLSYSHRLRENKAALQKVTVRHSVSGGRHTVILKAEHLQVKDAQKWLLDLQWRYYY